MPITYKNTVPVLERKDDVTYALKDKMQFFTDQVIPSNCVPLGVTKVIQTNVPDVTDLSDYISAGETAILVSQTNVNNVNYYEQTGANTAVVKALPDSTKNYIFIDAENGKAFYSSKTGMYAWIDCDHFTAEETVELDSDDTTEQTIYSSLPIPLNRYLHLNLTVIGHLVDSGGTDYLIRGEYEQLYFNKSGTTIRLNITSISTRSSDLETFPSPTITFGNDTSLKLTNGSMASGGTVKWFLLSAISV